MAYAYLSTLYGDTEESGLAKDSVSEAYQLRERASDRERLFIATWLDRGGMETWRRRGRSVKLGRKPNPRASAPPSTLSSGHCFVEISTNADTAPRRLKAHLSSIRTLPGGTPTCIQRYFAWAISTGQKHSSSSLRAQPGSTNVLAEQYDITFLRGNRTGMERAGPERGQSGEQKIGSLTKKHWSSRIRVTLQKAPRHLSSAPWIWLNRRTDRRGQLNTKQPKRCAKLPPFGSERDCKAEGGATLTLSKRRDVEYGAPCTGALGGFFPL